MGDLPIEIELNNIQKPPYAFLVTKLGILLNPDGSIQHFKHQFKQWMDGYLYVSMTITEPPLCLTIDRIIHAHIKLNLHDNIST